MAKSPPDDDPIRCLIFNMLQEQRFSTKAASRRIGKGSTYIHQYLFSGSPKALPEPVRLGLADLLGIDESVLRDPSLKSISSDLHKPHDGMPVIGRPFEGNDRMIHSSDRDVSGFEDRPFSLTGNMDAYCIDVFNSRLDPRHRKGERLYVNPFLDPEQGDTVVVRLKDDKATIGILSAISKKEVMILEFRPRKEMAYPKAEVESVDVVVSSRMK